MNIWIIHQNAYPPSGIASTRHFELSRRLITRGHGVTLVATSFDHKTKRETRRYEGRWLRKETVDGVPFLWIRTPPYRTHGAARFWNMVVFFWRVLALARTPSAERPDIVVGSTPPLPAALGAYLLARAIGKPFVLEIRDLWPLTLVEVGGLSGHHPVCVLFSLIEALLYRRSDAVVSLLPHAGGHIAERIGARRPVIWIPNGTDIDAFRPTDPNGETGPFRVLYCGAHGLANCLETVIEAAAALDKERNADGRPIHFHFYGEGNEKKSLRKLADSLGAKNIFFHDAVPKSGIPKVLASADMCVASLSDRPLYRFGISLNKLNDYLAAGKPVVLAGSPGNDPIRESGAGVTVPPQDPKALAEGVRRVAAMSGDERREMGRRGRRYAAIHHDFDRLARRLESALAQTAGKDRLRPAGGPAAEGKGTDAARPR